MEVKVWKILGCLLTITLLSGTSLAGDKPAHNRKWSHRKIPTLIGVPCKELENSTLFMVSMYTEGQPGREVIPNCTNMWFEQSNLDNVAVPSGVTMVGCSNRQIHVQNDMDDWIVEKIGEEWKPVEPLNKKERQKAGLSILPEDIPSKPFTEKERHEFENELTYGAGVTEPPEPPDLSVQ